MRTVVTGAGNPYGEAIVHELLKRDHQVRLFAVDAEVAQRFEGEGTVPWYAGHLETPGSIEPVLAEREVLVHAACLDEPTGSRREHALHIERGTLGCKYGAERELVDQFIHVAPATGGRDPYRDVQKAAADMARSTLKVPVEVITASDPETTAKQVADAIEGGIHLGRYPGRETDAAVP